MDLVQAISLPKGTSPLAPDECDHVDYDVTQTCPTRLPCKQVFLRPSSPWIGHSSYRELRKKFGVISLQH